MKKRKSELDKLKIDYGSSNICRVKVSEVDWGEFSKQRWLDLDLDDILQFTERILFQIF